MSIRPPGGGGGGGLTLLERVAVDAPVATVAFDDINQGFSHLRLVATVRSDRGAASSNDALICRINGDTGANYDWHLFRANDTADGHAKGVAAAYAYLANVPVASHTAGDVTSLELVIAEYAQSTFRKSLLSTWTMPGAAAPNTGLLGTLWNSSAAVTSLALSMLNASNFVEGSVLSLYGSA